MSKEQKIITKEDLLPLDAYTKVRRQMRKELVEFKKNRRILLGPYATFYFECYETMIAQVQEMLYIEKGGDEQIADELSKLEIPYGYKANLWKLNDPLPHTAWIKEPDQIGTNPIEVLGTRDDYSDEMFYNFSKKMIDKGATIIGGCCEIKPKHIKKVSELLN